MPTVFWTGRLSKPMKFIVNTNNLLAWVSGNARNTTAMKARVKKGYGGEVSKDVSCYDELGLTHYTKIAIELLNEINLEGKEVLEVGCGTGILSQLAIDKKPAKIICGDQAEYVLNQCRKKVTEKGASTQMEFRELDAESLPFPDESFDAVISSMMLGLVPNQVKAIKEMIRVLRSGGSLALSIQGPEYYWEACDAAFRKINIVHVLAYRIEYWPRNENDMKKYLKEAGMGEIKTRRLIWKDIFRTGAEAYDFFSSTSSGWWFSKFPKEKIARESYKLRDYFDDHNVTEFTQDIVFAYGKKA